MADKTFNEYQEQAETTGIYRASIVKYVSTLGITDPGKELHLVDLLCKCYAVLGLAGEAGELAGKMKKIIRDDAGVISSEKSAEMLAENGDVTWYNSQVASEFGADYGDVAQNNLDKLFSRKERGVLQGSGDNR